MPPKCEAPRGGGASRNSCGGCFRDLNTTASHLPQSLPPLIERHLGTEFLRSFCEMEMQP